MKQRETRRQGGVRGNRRQEKDLEAADVFCSDQLGHSPTAVEIQVKKKTGQDRTGQDRTGQDRTGQDQDQDQDQDHDLDRTTGQDRRRERGAE
eukprot:757152-Hanusia_phi.AAC.1